ncbi:MAG: hypothetical protein ACTSVG_11405 [Alphaproteobacteria bacterium]
MAATTVAGDVASLAALVAAAAALGFFSLPAGGRMIARFTQAAA